MKEPQFVGTFEVPESGNEVEVWYYGGSIFMAEYDGQSWSRVIEVEPLRDTKIRDTLTEASKKRHEAALDAGKE